MKTLIIQQRKYRDSRGYVNKNNLHNFLQLEKSITRLEVAYCHFMNIFDNHKKTEYKWNGHPLKKSIELQLSKLNFMEII